MALLVKGSPDRLSFLRCFVLKDTQHIRIIKNLKTLSYEISSFQISPADHPVSNRNVFFIQARRRRI